MGSVISSQEAAYWLTLAFQLKGTRPRDRNGLVLGADRRHRLGILDLVFLEREELPPDLQEYSEVHRALLEADGRVSAQAFLVRAMEEEGARLISITHSDYPRHLAGTLKPAKAPPVLSVAGDVSLLSSPGIAICGSRKAGALGLRFAAALGRALAERGQVVVTGLADGVDQEATNAALAAGGRVIGVSAAGLLKTPMRHRPEVLEGRLTVISEFSPRAGWQGWMAMQRNRTIAGLSRALVIADCGSEGGTTAQFDVHRDLGFPVYIRRGPGEGRLMAELSDRPGALPLNWSEGSAHRQADLVLGRASSHSVAITQSTNGERTRIVLEFGRGVDTKAVQDALRDALLSSHREPAQVAESELMSYGAPVAVLPRSLPAAQVAESAEGVEQSPVAQGLPGSKVDPVAELLRALGEQGGTLKELAKSLSWGAKKLDRRLKSMSEASHVTRKKDGRAYRYWWVDTEKSEEKSTEKKSAEQSSEKSVAAATGSGSQLALMS